MQGILYFWLNCIFFTYGIPNMCHILEEVYYHHSYKIQSCNSNLISVPCTSCQTHDPNCLSFFDFSCCYCLALTGCFVTLIQ